MMTNNSYSVEFTAASQDTPWQLSQPLPTDLRAVIHNSSQPTIDHVGKAFATFVGEEIEAQEIETTQDDMLWALRVRLRCLPTDIVVWVEALNDAGREATGVQDGWILALQTILHAGDPLTHFSNLLRLLSNADLDIESICDAPTGRWFPRQVLDNMFVTHATQPPEEVLWMTRVVESPQESEPEERWAWVTTHGLARCGRVELEMLGVPALLTTEAVHLVDGLAALTLESPLPPVAQVVSLGPDILVSMLHCGDAIDLLEAQMPGRKERTIPSVAIASPDGSSSYPAEALNAIRGGNTAVAKTARSTKRQTILARDAWKLLLEAAQQIGESEHAACMVQVPWTNSEDEDSPSEYLWFRVTKVEPPRIIAVLAHEPKFAVSLKEGHLENLCVEDVTDWVLMTPVGPMGPGDAEAIGEFLHQFIN